MAEMRRMLEAILAQDGPAACRACIEHVERAAAIAAQVFEQQGAKTSSTG